MERISKLIADAVIGIDTLWGGDVMCPSGTGRFIADSWFSDEPLPEAYTHATAERLRKLGGVAAKEENRAAAKEYIAAIKVREAIEGVGSEAKGLGGTRGRYLAGLALCLDAMWALAMEVIGAGPALPYEQSVIASTGRAPEPSQPGLKRERVRELLAKAGYKPAGEGLLGAVDAWRAERLIPMASVQALGQAAIAHFDQLSARNVVPYLPRELAGVPRANIQFLPIKDAWFSGSMNYIGRARNADGSPQYEASYEINASLKITYPEFEQLVSHEVVPGHVTTFAYLQNLHVRGLAGFEATVLTMNTRAATLFEGIANNAILMAYGVKEVEDLPDEDLQVGVLLALLQDDAKNQSSYLTWGEKREQGEVARALRSDFLVTEERADKLSGAWGRHPLLGRMYLPAYRTGTERVAELRRRHKPEKILPALFGCGGMVDIESIEAVLQG